MAVSNTHPATAETAISSATDLTAPQFPDGAGPVESSTANDADALWTVDPAVAEDLAGAEAGARLRPGEERDAPPAPPNEHDEPQDPAELRNEDSIFADEHSASEADAFSKLTTAASSRGDSASEQTQTIA